MPIYSVAGDILNTQAQTIAHGVAPGENYPTGVALALRIRFPAAVKNFKAVCRRQRLQPGDIHLWKGPEKWILNLLTQDEAYTKDVRVTRAHAKYLQNALACARREVVSLGIRSIALPKICAGLGKMSWEEVFQLLEQEWGCLPIPIFLYSEFLAGQSAEEEERILRGL